MDFFELIQRRQSVRAYKRGAVTEELLRKILEAVRTAPTAGNFQSYEVYVVERRRLEELTAATFDQKFLAEADLALVFCANPARCEFEPPETWAIEDTTIATTYAVLAIEALGLATCWIGAFDADKVSKIIHAPAGIQPISIVPVAAAGESPERTPRRRLEEFVHRTP
jgi:nitroreductase